MSDEFLPTTEQIRAECEAIRAEWSPEERAKRGSVFYKPAAIPWVRTGELPAHVELCVHDEI
jgi:hypothetical protein